MGLVLLALSSAVSVSAPSFQISADQLQIMDQNISLPSYSPGFVYFIIGKAFSPPILHPVPEAVKLVKRNIIDLVFRCPVKHNKGNAALFLEFLHKPHLVFVDILQGKGGYRALFGVKAYGDSLNRSYIVHGALLIKVGQGDMPGLLVYGNGRNGGRDFLNESQFSLPIYFIAVINHVFQGGAPKAPAVPCSHMVCSPVSQNPLCFSSSASFT